MVSWFSWSRADLAGRIKDYDVDSLHSQEAGRLPLRRYRLRLPPVTTVFLIVMSRRST
ncbi:MAG: hypothetical protein MZV63_01545 [Marinilabiliales bacterium]|nr:hypothetical protein [Marinilabiliales bacterium]